LAHITPLLGLFGTVLGMIAVFRRVQELQGQADVTVLAGGIWEALLTTAFGLAIAIPCAAAYHYFQSLASRHISRMTNIVAVLTETFAASTSRAGRVSGGAAKEEQEDAEV